MNNPSKKAADSSSIDPGSTSSNPTEKRTEDDNNNNVVIEEHSEEIMDIDLESDKGEESIRCAAGIDPDEKARETEKFKKFIWDCVQHIAPDLPRKGATAPVYNGPSSSSECSFASDPKSIRIGYTYNGEVGEPQFEIIEYGGYTFAPATGWFRKEHLRQFQDYVSSQARMIRLVYPRAPRSLQYPDVAAADRPSEEEVNSWFLMVCFDGDFEKQKNWGVATRTRHVETKDDKFEFGIDRNQALWVQHFYTDPSTNKLENSGKLEIRIYAHGRAGPAVGWNNVLGEIALENYLIDCTKNMPKDLFEKALAKAKAIREGHRASIETTRQLAEALHEAAKRESSKNALTVQSIVIDPPTNEPDTSMRHPVLSLDQIIDMSGADSTNKATDPSKPLKRKQRERKDDRPKLGKIDRYPSGSESDSSTDDDEERIPIHFNESTNEHATRLSKRILKQKRKRVARMDLSDEGRNDPDHPYPSHALQVATLYDLSFTLQTMWKIHQEDKKKLEKEIEGLKNLIKENSDQLKADRSERQRENRDRESRENRQPPARNVSRDRSRSNVRRSSTNRDNRPSTSTYRMTEYGFPQNRDSRNPSRNPPRSRNPSRSRARDRSTNRCAPSTSRSNSQRSVPGPSRQNSLTFVLENMRPKATRKFPKLPTRTIHRNPVNWDGTPIDYNLPWHDLNVPAHITQRSNFGEGMYVPNYEGANYEWLADRLIEEATNWAEYAYPPPGLPGAKRFGYHRHGTDDRQECLCCFDSHRPINCRIFGLASARRRLADARSVCYLCRTVHPPNDLCPPSNTEYPRCTDPACDGLPAHHEMFCDNTPRNREVMGKMGLR